MRISVIQIANETTEYAFGSDPDNVMVGKLAATLGPEACLYAAAGFPRGALVADHDPHVMLLVDGDLAGWRAYRGRNDGDWTCVRVDAWTKWTHRDHGKAEVWVLVLSAANDGQKPSFIARPGETVSLAEACSRLIRFGHDVGHPFVLTPGHTAHLALRAMLKPDPARKGVQPDRRVEPWWGTGTTAEAPAMAGGDLIWSRRPRKHEMGGWVHAFDRNAARLAAMNGAMVAAGKLERRGPIGFDTDLAGYWWIEKSHLSRRHVVFGRDWPEFINIDLPQVVVTTPIMIEWTDRGVLPPVSDSLVAPARRLFRTATERWNTARLNAPHASPYQAAVKAVYRAGNGLFASAGGLIHRPDWYHTIMDSDRVAMIRTVGRVHERTGKLPIRIHTDCLWYATETEDAETFAEEAGINLDPHALGRFKLHSSMSYDQMFPRKERVA